MTRKSSPPGSGRGAGGGLVSSNTSAPLSSTAPADPSNVARLDEPLSTNELTEIAKRIRARIRRTAEDIIAVGQDLITVKAQLGHGRFLEWIDREFGMTDRTARKYMQVTAWAEGKSESVSDLPVSTLYLLAAPSAPPEVADDVIAQAESGETVKAADVKRQIEEAQAERKTTEADRLAEEQKPKNGDAMQAALAYFKKPATSREHGREKIREWEAFIYHVTADAYRAAREERPDSHSDAEWADEAGVDRGLVSVLSLLCDANVDALTFKSWKDARVAALSTIAEAITSLQTLKREIEACQEDGILRFAAEDLDEDPAEDPVEDDDDDPLAIPACFKRAPSS